MSCALFSVINKPGDTSRSGLNGSLVPPRFAGQLQRGTLLSVHVLLMLVWPVASKGFALPLALTTSALLLLSSLSLQTLALHARQRSSHALATAQTRDAELSVAMAFQQHAAGAHACLLALPSSEWESSERCPRENPALLQSGLVDDRDWQLLDWQPKGTRAGTLQLRWSDARQSRLDLELQP